jgi:hypothetical protein
LLFVVIVVGKSSKQQNNSVLKTQRDFLCSTVQIQNTLMTTTILTEFVKALCAPLGV